MLKKINWRNLTIYFIFLVMIFPFFRISILSRQMLFRKVYLVLEINSFLIILLLSIKNNYKMSKVILSLIMFFILLGFSTVLNFSAIKDYILMFFRTITLCIITEYGIVKDKKRFLKTMSVFLKLLIYINFISIIVFRNGMYVRDEIYYQNWILGYKNALILYIFPALISTFLSSYFKYKKITVNDIFFMFICILSVLIVNSSASLVGLSFIFIYAVFPFIFDDTLLFNIYNYYKVNVACFIGFILLRLQKYFSFIIEKILHKSVTFTGRTSIWDNAINMIKTKPIFGHGYEKVEVREMVVGNNSNHNFILEIWNNMGIIGVIFYFYIMILVGKKLYKYKNLNISKFLSVMVLSLIMVLLVESYSYANVMYLFVIAFNVEHLINNE